MAASPAPAKPGGEGAGAGAANGADGGGATYDVFLSYSHDAKDAVARPLAEGLEQKGLGVWWDQAEMEIGDALRDRIRDGVNKAAHGIAVVSRGYLESGWGQAELGAMFGRGLPIYCILHGVDAEAAKKRLPAISETLMRDWVGSPEGAIAAEIADAIGAGRRGQAAGSPPAPSVPRGALPCPFCGGIAAPRRPWGSRVSGSSVGVDAVSVRISVDAGGGEEYLKCNGCGTAFVPADREIGTILPGMKVRLKAAIRAKHYYGSGVTVRGLLARHRTAIVRTVRERRSFLSPSASRTELVVCFSYRGVRTFGTLRRRRGGNGYYYELAGLDRV